MGELSDAFLQELQQAVSLELKKQLNAERSWHAEKVPRGVKDASVLFEAMHYALHGGKRVRPILLLLSYEAISRHPYADVLPFAAALEMVHAYSLVHDDLPAMDGDVLRRGMPTVHVQFGEDMAILAGDALLNLAYETGLRNLQTVRMQHTSVDPFHALQAMRLLAESAGAVGMVDGQVYDLQTELLTSREAIRFMVQQKTGALLRCACEMGAILGGAEETTRRQFQQFGQHIGNAFQARDDLFDREQDMAEGKRTIITGMSLDEAERFVKAESDAGIASIAGIPQTEALREFAQRLVHRTH